MQNSAYQTPGHDEIRLLRFSDLRMKEEGLMTYIHKKMDCCDVGIIAMGGYLDNQGIMYILAFPHISCTINMNK